MVIIRFFLTFVFVMGIFLVSMAKTEVTPANSYDYDNVEALESNLTDTMQKLNVAEGRLKSFEGRVNVVGDKIAKAMKDYKNKVDKKLNEIFSAYKFVIKKLKNVSNMAKAKFGVGVRSS